MKMTINPNRELVDKIREKIAANGGYCCCSLIKNEDTKCPCKEVADMVENGISGTCRCKLYTVSE